MWDVMSSTVLSPRTEKVSIRLTVEEKRLAEKLARFLKSAGKIEEATISSALRVSLIFTVTEILKDIERRRYSR